MDVLYGVRMAGPLAPYARGLAGELARLGFTELSSARPARAGRAPEPVAGCCRPGTAGTDRPAVEAYLAARHAAGYTAYLTPKALAPLLELPARAGRGS